MNVKGLAAFALITVLSIAGAFIVTAQADEAAPDGKAVFLAQKCEMCHSVSSASIVHTTKSEKMVGPDLTGHMEGLDRDALLKFITKQTDKEGKKHPKELSGTDAEIKAMLDWLSEQKKPA